MWVANLGDVDAFLVPTGLWGVDFSLLASCATQSTHLCLFTLEKANQLRKNKALFLSLEHQSNQARGNEVEMECDIWGKAFL